MYERSAIVLERYLEKVLKFDKTYNLKKNNENYSELISEIENYQIMTNRETKVIQEFDDAVGKIEGLQQEQERLYKANIKLENDRAQFFKDLGEDAEILNSKFKRIENTLDKNNAQLKEIREEFVQQLNDFAQKQKDRNKCDKAKRIGEAKHIEYIKRMHTEFAQIDVKDVVEMKDFITSEKEQIKQEAFIIMSKNGKSERVVFDQDVLRKAISARIDIAEKEADCYTSVYDKMKRLLAETDNETIRLNKYKKTLRDTSVKLAFLEAEKDYIVGFLDYERMTAINGIKAHKKMMVEACNNFERDLIQIRNLYELILKEVASRSTKKAYKELYNKTYLRNIEDKEKNFEQEVNNVNISMGTVINSNYWRIEGIKNIYNVFQEEVSSKFEKDLSEFRIDEEETEPQMEQVTIQESYYTKLESEKKPSKKPQRPLRIKESYNNQEDYYDEDEEEEENDYSYANKNYDINEYEDYEEYEEEEEEEEEESSYSYANKAYNTNDYKDEEDDYYEDEQDDYTEYEEYEEDDDDEYDQEYATETYDEDDYEEDDDVEELDYRNYKLEQNSRKAQIEEQEKDQYIENYINNYEEDQEDEEDDDYKAYYERRRTTYDDYYDDDDEYENIYEYKYEEDEEDDDDSFDDEESLDNIIAKSRKKPIKRTTHKRGNKGILDKFFNKDFKMKLF